MPHLICDAHNHLLQNMDSGASTLEESITMARALYAQKVRYAIVCPHFHEQGETINRFITRRNHEKQLLIDAFPAGEKRIRIITSAEVELSNDLIQMPDLEKLLIPSTRFLPIALPLSGIGDDDAA